MSKKLLFDISHGIHGNTGIQQDMRRILSILSKIDNLEIDVLIYDMIDNNRFTDFEIQKGLDERGSMVTQAQMSHYYFNPSGQAEFNSRVFGRIRRNNHERRIKKNKQLEMLELNKKYNEAYYRKLLMDSFESDFLDKFKTYTIYLTNYSSEGSVLGMMNSGYEIPHLNTEEYDYVLFFQELPVSVSSGTRKIVRSYDLIQIYGPDVVFKADYKANYQYRSIQECLKQDAEFLTISNTVMDEIESTFGQKPKGKTIPVPVSSIFKPMKGNFDLISFIRSHDDQEMTQSEKVSDRKKLEYFLSVSTIEPRKNIVSAYKAFKKFKQICEDESLVFLLIGKVGWNLDLDYTNMLRDQDVVVLSNVSTQELPMLYSNAISLVYVPFQEGFGLPPAEAMLCDCPVILSDIPVHREVHSDNGYYVNHYDGNDIAKKMLSVYELRGTKQVNDMTNKANNYARKYMVESLAPMWAEVFS